MRKKDEIVMDSGLTAADGLRASLITEHTLRRWLRKARRSEGGNYMAGVSLDADIIRVLGKVLK